MQEVFLSLIVFAIGPAAVGSAPECAESRAIYVVAYIDVREQPARRNSDPVGRAGRSAAMLPRPHVEFYILWPKFQQSMARPIG